MTVKCPNCGWEFDTECIRCQYFPELQPPRDDSGFTFILLYLGIIFLVLSGFVAWHWYKFGSPYA